MYLGLLNVGDEGVDCCCFSQIQQMSLWFKRKIGEKAVFYAILEYSTLRSAGAGRRTTDTSKTSLPLRSMSLI